MDDDDFEAECDHTMAAQVYANESDDPYIQEGDYILYDMRTTPTPGCRVIDHRQHVKNYEEGDSFMGVVVGLVRKY